MSSSLLKKINKTDSCWLWTGCLDRHGYGRLGGRLAHRLVYETLVGTIPQGLTIDHLCRNRSCMNPGHMEPVTQKVNTLRGIGFSAINAKKTHCPAGHELSGENAYLRPVGGRNCRACNRESARRYYERNAA